MPSTQELHRFLIETEAGMEGETFVFLTDTNEWAVETETDAVTIRAALPDAKVRAGDLT